MSKKQNSNYGVACPSLYRRRFLTTMSKYAASLPVAAAILKARTVHAQQRPVRVIAFKTFHGNNRNWWVPKTTSGQIPGGTDVDMSTLILDYADATLRPLHAFRDKMLVLDGLDHCVVPEYDGSHGHNGGPTALTGYGYNVSGPSIDQLISERLGSAAGRAMVLGADAEYGGFKSTFYNQNGNAIRPSEDARREYDLVFQGFTPPDTNPTPTPETPAVSQNALYAAILDKSATRINGLRTELTGSEREKLDAHLAGLERLKAQFAETGGSTNPTGPVECSPTQPPSSSGSGSRASMESKMTSIAHLIGQAFACDLSRVAGVQIGGDWMFPFPTLEADFHNTCTHTVHTSGGNVNTSVKDRYVDGMRFCAEQVAKVLQVLDVPDPAASEGTLLDNTVLFWTNEVSCTGMHDDDWMTIPAIIAGGGGGKIRQGRYLRFHEPWAGYSGARPQNGTPHNKVLTSICHAVGLTDINYVGDPRAASNSRYQGPLSEIMT